MTEPSLHRHTATKADSDRRLDRVLADNIDDFSRSRIKTLIEAGSVTVNGATITDPSHTVKPGQIFAMIVPDSQPASIEPEAIDLDILYEDEDVIVIDKPAGMVVHPAPGTPGGTLVNALLAHCGDSLSGIGGVRRPGIVHRLDKDTSGVMVAAKNDAAHQSLAKQFAARTIERAYTAVVWGVPAPPVGVVDGNIGRSERNRLKMTVVRAPKGRVARTRYRVTEPLGPHACVMQCRLDTGRTHQIRVHMTHIGHPLVGDPVYGRQSSARTRTLSQEARTYLASFNRQALHANLIGFIHPRDQNSRLFESKIPKDIKSLINLLRL
jgi:23S rRNA pseudouridine1911/1915/1917 synthase